MKFDFDKKLGIMVPSRRNKESIVGQLNRLPGRSSYIYLLINMNPNSVGNLREREKVWYDASRWAFASDANSKDFIKFRDYRMKNGTAPKYWMYA